MTAFADRLRARRREMDYTQGEVGVALDRTATCVSYWETGRREPRLEDLARLAHTLEVSVDWLVLGKQSGTICAANRMEIGPATLVTSGATAQEDKS